MQRIKMSQEYIQQYKGMFCEPPSAIGISSTQVKEHAALKLLPSRGKKRVQKKPWPLAKPIGFSAPLFMVLTRTLVIDSWYQPWILVILPCRNFAKLYSTYRQHLHHLLESESIAPAAGLMILFSCTTFLFFALRAAMLSNSIETEKAILK